MTKPPLDPALEDRLDAEADAYARDLHELRKHARAIARYLGGIGVPRGETRMCLVSLVNAGVTDGYDDLVDG